MGPLCLTAMRRAQGDPPPLVIRVADDPPFVDKDGVVSLVAELINQEKEFPSLVWAMQDPHYEQGPPLHLHVNVTAVDPTPAVSPADGRYTVTRIRHMQIPPDRRVVVPIDLSDYAVVGRTGTYDVTVAFDPVFRRLPPQPERISATPSVTRRITLPRPAP